MDKTARMTTLVLLVVAAALLLAVATGCSSDSEPETTEPTATEPAPAETDPAAEGETAEDPSKALVDSKCSLCHTLDRVYDADYTRDEWVTNVDRMISNGLVVTDEEYEEIIDYLSQ